jgi:hypothetical protein
MLTCVIYALSTDGLRSPPVWSLEVIIGEDTRGEVWVIVHDEVDRSGARETVGEYILERDGVAVDLVVDALLGARDNVAVAPVGASNRRRNAGGGKVGVDIGEAKVVGNGEKLGQGEMVSIWVDEGRDGRLTPVVETQMTESNLS